MISQIVLISLLSASSLAMPSSSPPPCICSDGTGIYPGQTHNVTDCDICRCNEQGGVSTDHINCTLPGCVKPYSVEGDGVCCPSCPKGPDCEAIGGPEIFNRNIIPADNEVHYLQDYSCTCNGPSPANATCVPYPGPTCFCKNGQFTIPGRPIYITDCDVCACGETYGKYQFFPCLSLPCVDPVNVEGDRICCPYCPNGPNCQLITPDGVRHIIPDNGTIPFYGGTCTCIPFDYSGYMPREAHCEPPPVPPSPVL